MKILSASLTAAILTVGAANAQEVTYLSFGLGFDSIERGPISGEFTYFDGTVEYSVNQFYLMAEANAVSFSSAGMTNELSGLEARIGYEFDPMGIVYAGVRNVDFVGSNDATIYTLGGNTGLATSPLVLTIDRLMRVQLKPQTLLLAIRSILI